MIGVTVIGESRERCAAVLAVVAAEPTLRSIGALPRRPVADGVVVLEIGPDDIPVVAEKIERLAERHTVLAALASPLPVDKWLLRSLGVRGILPDLGSPSAIVEAIHQVAGGGESWPADSCPQPGWFAEPLTRRLCGFVRDRERARLDSVLAEQVVRTLDDLAEDPLVGPGAGRLLRQEARRMRGSSSAAAERSEGGCALQTELREAAEGFGGALDIGLNLGDGPGADVPPRTAAVVAAAAREALRNVVKHAGTDVAWIRMRSEPGVVSVSVADKGCGFDPEACHQGFGLKESVRERMRSVGGRAEVLSTPGGGTIVTLTVPVA
jgi:hypothetical protein